jgi:hypothetical protein
MAGTMNIAGTLGITGDGTVAITGTTNVAGSIAITGGTGTVDARESAFSGKDDFFLVQ